MKEAKRMEKEEAEKPEKEALEFYRQLQEEENSKEVILSLSQQFFSYN